VPAHLIAADHAIWQPVAHALAQLLHTLVLATAPRRILVGGGVLQERPELFAPLRARLASSLNGYLTHEDLAGGLERYVAPPGLGEAAGPLGALALAADALGAD
jgi:fructokinase